jgi:outer membrane lipoprotein-sorting protein
MNDSTQENQPELLDQLCLAIATQEVPALASEPVMPWEKSGNLGTTNPRRHNMSRAARKVDLTRLTSWRGWLTVSVVAVVVLVCGFLMSGLTNSNSAFAQVQEAAAKIRSVRFRTLEYDGDRDPKVTSIVILSGVGGRSDSSDGVEVVSDYKSGKRLSLDHRSKTAEVVQTFDSTPSLEQLWARFLELPSDKVKKLEAGTIDGKKVNRFEVQENGTLIVSVDPSTNLPARMEMEVDSGSNGNKRHRHVATDFIFNSAVDPSLLSTAPPAEYQLTESARPSSRKPFRESDLIVSPETGIGGVTLGSSKDVIIAKLGQPDSIRETSVPGQEIPNPDNTKTKLADTVIVQMQYPSDGFDLTIGASGLERIHCYGKQFRGAMAQDFVGKTDAGIKIGATTDDVIAKYGRPDVRSGGRHEDLFYIHKGYRFRFVEGKLASVTVSAPMPKEVKVIDKGNGSFELWASEDE